MKKGINFGYVLTVLSFFTCNKNKEHSIDVQPPAPGYIAIRNILSLTAYFEKRMQKLFRWAAIL